MKKIAFSLIVGALFLGNSSHLHAQILFNNGSAAVGPAGYGYYADTGNTGNPLYVYSEAGDVFTPSLSGTVNYVDFAGLYYGGGTPTTNTFVLSLYLADGGAPDTDMLIGTSNFSSYSQSPVGTHGALTIYEFSGFLEMPFTITAGTPYYFGISDTSDSYQNFSVVVSASVPPGGSTAEYSLVGGTSTFNPTGPDALSFDLQSEPVPEPSEWWLFVSGCVGLVLGRRCVRRSPQA